MVRYSISLVALVALGVPCFAQEEAVAKARAEALLRLNAPQAAAQTPACPFCEAGPDCTERLAKGKALASLQNKQLFIWVGGKDAKAAGQLDGVHVEVSTHNQKSDRRVVLPMPDGEYWFEVGNVTGIKNFLARHVKTSATAPIYHRPAPVAYYPVAFPLAGAHCGT